MGHLGLTPTFQLYSGGAAFLKEPGRVPHRLFRRKLVRQKRHVGHHQGSTSALRYRARMVNYSIQGYRDGGIETQDHIPEGVAHE